MYRWLIGRHAWTYLDKCVEWQSAARQITLTRLPVRPPLFTRAERRACAAVGWPTLLDRRRVAAAPSILNG